MDSVFLTTRTDPKRCDCCRRCDFSPVLSEPLSHCTLLQEHQSILFFHYHHHHYEQIPNHHPASTHLHLLAYGWVLICHTIYHLYVLSFTSKSNVDCTIALLNWSVILSVCWAAVWWWFFPGGIRDCRYAICYTTHIADSGFVPGGGNYRPLLLCKAWYKATGRSKGK